MRGKAPNNRNIDVLGKKSSKCNITFNTKESISLMRSVSHNCVILNYSLICNDAKNVSDRSCMISRGTCCAFI